MLTSDAVYRIRDADAIFRIERKDDEKIAQNSKLFYTKYFEFTSNHCGSVRGTLWRIVSKYILFVCAWFRRFSVGTCRTRQITLWALGLITTEYDVRPIRKRNMPAVFKRLLLDSYLNQRICAARSACKSYFFQATNGVKQGSEICSQLMLMS